MSASKLAESAADQRSWEARPVAARAIRCLVVLGPISVGCAAAIIANRWIAMPESILVAIARSVLIVVISTAVVWAVDRYARKLLPLAALMQLSLVFPDRAPSRFKSALKSGSSRRLERTLDETRRHGLSKDPGDAARQVVQLIGAIGDHDRRTRGHSERVRLYADLVGEELKLSKEERQKLQWGALLHDLGKLMVPSEILNKNGKPDAEEWRILQGHPAAGMRLIEPLRDFLGEWVHAIGGHHEKWDGSGYPAGLRGDAIPRAAAIVAVADSFEVMTAVRSYKKAMPLAEARAELTRCAGQHFSPEVVRAFLNISLGHLRLVSGPLAALAHLPFLGNLAQIPAAAAAAPAMVNAAALPAAAMVTAAALTVGGTVPRADAVELVQTERPAAVASAAGNNSPTSAAPTTASSVASGVASTTSTTAATTDATVPPALTPGAVTGGPTTTTAPAAAAPGAAAPATAAPATSAAPVVPTAPSPTTTRRPTTTTTTTAAPPVTAPPTTAASPTTTAAATAFPLQYATNGLRIPSMTLNGASIARGTKIYVTSAVSADRVEYTYPGGSRTANDFPYDMMGGSLFSPNSFTLPSTPGTYTITATARRTSGQNWTGTVTATFTVT